MKRIFNFLDITRDGSIEFDEFSIFIQFIISINTNNESKKEYEDFIFGIVDRNKDGVVTNDDLLELRSIDFIPICPRFDILVKNVSYNLDKNSLKDKKNISISKNKFIEIMDINH